MNKIATVAVAAMIALTLAGCAGVSTNAADVATTDGATPAATSSATPTDAPDATTPTPVPTDQKADAATIFLGAMHSDGATYGFAPKTDDEWLGYAHDACTQLRAGVPIDSVVVITGSYSGEPRPGWNNRSIVGIASETFCTDYSQTHPDH